MKGNDMITETPIALEACDIQPGYSVKADKLCPVLMVTRRIILCAINGPHRVSLFIGNIIVVDRAVIAPDSPLSFDAAAHEIRPGTPIYLDVMNLGETLGRVAAAIIGITPAPIPTQSRGLRHEALKRKVADRIESSKVSRLSAEKTVEDDDSDIWESPTYDSD